MILTRAHILLLSLFLSTLFSCSQLFAQIIDLDKKITVIAKEKTLAEIINEISDKGEIKFSFSTERIPLDSIVTITARNKKIKKILEELFNKVGLEYQIIEEQVVLQPVVDKDVENTGTEDKSAKHTISGYMRDNRTGEVLISATMVVEELKAGVISNAYGFYSITLPEGRYNLTFSFLGYESISIPVDLKKNVKVSPDMKVKHEVLREVTVFSDGLEGVEEQSRMSEIRIRPKTINKFTRFMGEVDVIKSLQSIPGIKSYGDGSTSFYVRGGDKDQNLILIDEAPIYNPSHLLGFFSIISPNAVKIVEVYKGDIPANYGGRLSSIIDIRTKDGNFNKLGIYGSLGAFSSNLCIEGPIVRDKSSFFISGRGSHLKWLIKNELTKSVYFFDFNTKFNIRINDNNRLFLSLYSGTDFFSQGTETRSLGIQWGNSAGTLRWNHLFNDKLFSNTTVNFSNYNYFLFMSIEDNNYWNSYIYTGSLKTDFTWFMDPVNKLKFGIKFNGHNFNPGNLHIPGVDEEDLPHVSNYHVNENILYISHEYKFRNRLFFRYGCRMPTWNNVGPARVYIFDGNYNVSDTLDTDKGEIYNSYVNFEPRTSIKYRIDSLSSASASYCRTYQHLQLLSNTVSPFTSLDVWIPSGPNILPLKADQFILGYNRRLPKYNLEVSLEGFYKKMYNQIDYKDHANMLLNPLIEGELRFGQAWAYGGELLLKRSEGRMNGWVGYTYSRAIKQIFGINNNEKYPAFYDRPHDVSFFMNYRINPKLSLSSNFIYSTGAAVTMPTGFYNYQGYTIPIYSEKHNDRLPDYHRLDVSITYQFNKPDNRYRHSLTLSVYNIYGKRNPISINFNKIINENGQIVLPVNYYDDTELIITKMSLLGIIPSLNYNFKF